MERKNSTNTKAEVNITHIFNAPREVVFKAWADPQQLVKWYAPPGCTIHYKTLDIRNGGSFHSCIENPQFGECWCKGKYHEVVYPERLVFSMAISDKDGNDLDPIEAGMDPEWPRETMVTVIFTALGNKTQITLHQTVSESLAKKTGAYPSWLQQLENLEALLKG